MKIGEKLHDVIYLTTGEADSNSFLGCKVSKIPQKLFSIFKEPFERTQNFVFSREGDIDVEAYAEDFVPDYDVHIGIFEDVEDSNYIMFDSINYEILGIESRVLKSDFWSADFGKKYPKMAFLKDFVSTALSEWGKTWC